MPGRSWDCAKHGHVLHTERLLIAGVTANDRNGWFASIDDDVMRWQGYRPDDLAEHFELARLSVGRLRPYREVWAVARSADYAFLGVQSVTQVAPDALETGGWLRADARGLGYASEVARAVTAFAHEHLGFERVVAATETTNDRALRQYLAAGFVECSQGRRELPNGRSIDAVRLEHELRTAPEDCPHRAKVDAWLVDSRFEFSAPPDAT